MCVVLDYLCFPANLDSRDGSKEEQDLPINGYTSDILSMRPYL